MTSSNLKLYVDNKFISPYAMSAFVALHEKNLPFAIEPVDISHHGARSQAFVTASLTQRVSTLKHSAFCVSESSAITEYLDEVFAGTSLYPKTQQNRAIARQVQAWLRSDLMPIRQERSTEVLFYAVKKATLSTEAKCAADKLISTTQRLITTNQAYLFDEWCIADLDLALMLNRLILNGDEVPDDLANYAARQWERASAQLWINLKRPLL